MTKRLEKNKRRKSKLAAAETNRVSTGLVFRSVISMVIAFATVGVLTLLAGPPAKTVVEYNPNIDPRYPAFMQRAQPEVVLLGNSMLGEGVDEQLLMRMTGERTLKLWGGGWSSAIWYLVLKNVIIPADPRPDTVVLFFRDHFLTDPTFRVTGDYKKVIDQFTGPSEPLLERYAYLNAMDPLTYWFNQNWSLIQKRGGIKGRLESNIKSWAGNVYGNDDVDTVNGHIKRMFKVENLLAEQLGQAQLESEQVKDKGLYDFEASLPVSFLPAMVELAKDSDIQLIFVRVKRRREVEGLPRPEGLDAYIKALQQWFSGQGVTFIDFSDNPDIKLEHYADGDHLNRADGRRLFTRLLVDELKKRKVSR